LFSHPARKEFPKIYRLYGQHPLRPSQFTRDRYPLCAQSGFKDYVVAIHKEFSFMKDWQALGEETATPSNDVASNLENGNCLTDISDPPNLTSTQAGFNSTRATWFGFGTLMVQRTPHTTRFGFITLARASVANHPMERSLNDRAGVSSMTKTGQPSKIWQKKF
jgi:hypothetical protein